LLVDGSYKQWIILFLPLIGSADADIEGSVCKGSISIYFQFSYTIRQILTSTWCQFF